MKSSYLVLIKALFDLDIILRCVNYNVTSVDSTWILPIYLQPEEIGAFVEGMKDVFSEI